MPAIDKSHWQALSPLLDELLDLAPPAQALRLQALRAQDPALAEDLQTLLQRQAEMENTIFLNQPALPRPEVEAGQSVGAYTLEREIGQGGMGTVWLARRTDGRFDGQVAIKFLSIKLLGQAQAQADGGRFAREGQILARLAHPHIARLLDAGLAQQGRQPYLVLEYVDGQPINAYCEQQQLDVASRVRLFMAVLAAVAHAHSRLILHRDLKPSNILVNRNGEVKLLDFGVAKLLNDSAPDAPTAPSELTQQVGRSFTPQYAAPEQVQGDEVSTATDVYALGVLLFLLLSGEHPTAKTSVETTPLERLRAIVETEPKRMSEHAAGNAELPPSERQRRARELRGDLDTIVAKALKKRPAERYASAADLAEDLRRWLAHEPISARPDSRLYQLRKFVRRHRLAVAAGSVASLALGAALGLALLEGREAQRQRDQAEGLIEFMLGDLRKKLEPVGRLDVLDAVGDKALAYYAQQQLGSQDSESLSRRAHALHLMGEIAEKRGQMDQAEQRFAQAAQSTAELLAREPRNPQRLFDQAQSSYWLGYAAFQQRRWPQAEAAFQRYLALAQQLVALAPQKAEWQSELASAHNNLGVLALRQGQAEAALPRFAQALALRQALLPQQPALSNDISDNWGWQAEAQEALGRFQDAIASQQAKLAALAPNLQGQAPNRAIQGKRAATEIALSRLYLNLGQGSAALAAAEQARSGYAELAALDPDNLDALGRLGFARQQWVETALALGDAAGARAELALLQPELQRLLAAKARKPAWRLNLQGRYLTAQLSAAVSPKQRAASARALAALLGSAIPPTEGTTLDDGTRWALGRAALALGEEARAEGEAAQYWQQVQALLGKAATNEEPRVICLRAWALWRLGQTQEAQALADKLEASAYRHPLWVELRQRMRPS